MSRKPSLNHQNMSSVKSSMSSKNVNLLAHPDGQQVYMKKLAQLQKKKQAQTDFSMLRNIPDWYFKPQSQEIRKESFSSQIDQVENPEDSKAKYKKNQNRVVFGKILWNSGYETSQLDESDEQLNKFLDECSQKNIQKSKDQGTKKRLYFAQGEELMQNEVSKCLKSQRTIKKKLFQFEE